MIAKFLGAIVRAALQFYGGTLIEKGLVSADQLSQAIGAIIFLCTLAWSMYQKYRATKKYDPNTPVRVGIPLK